MSKNTIAATNEDTMFISLQELLVKKEEPYLLDELLLEESNDSEGWWLFEDLLVRLEKACRKLVDSNM